MNIMSKNKGITILPAGHKNQTLRALRVLRGEASLWCGFVVRLPCGAVLW